MNPNYVHTITLYNRIRAADTEDRRERWVRTVLPDCFFKSRIVVGYTGQQAEAGNTYVVRIPQDERYRPYREFAAAPEGYFTLSTGDIVVCGQCEDEITGESGQTAAQVLERHKPDAFKVSAVTDNTSFRLAKHYRLGG